MAEPLAPGEKTRLGYGLVWSRMDSSTLIYARKLGVDEVRQRIDRYYRPYHAALGRPSRRPIDASERSGT